jgi:general secretion pathway protein E
MDSQELSSLGVNINQIGPVKLHRGKGCIKCRGTGYFGRTGIYEVLPISESISRYILPETNTELIREMAIKNEGMVTLRENAIKKMLEGITTYQEVLRVTWEQV